jgi:hypothetical protein
VNVSTDNMVYHQPIDVNVLNYLTDYLDAGFNLFPLKERDKIPAIKWKPLLKKPLTIDELKQFYETNPKLNIGIIMGPTSGGLIVLDVDHSPPEQLVFLLAENPTAAVQTSRGRHYYFRSKKKLPNLNFNWGELRSNDVYVVAPPSIHPNGIRYDFLNDCHLNEIVEIPDAILKFLTTRGSVVGKRGNVNPDSGLTSKSFKGNSKGKLPSNELIYPLLGNYTVSRDSPYSLLGNFGNTYKDPEIALKVMRSLGINVSKLGEAFRCPIHEDVNPSAALWKGKNGTIMLHEFHQGDNFWTLPEMYASYICHKKEFMKLSKSQMVEWWIRVLENIGHIQLPTIKFKPLPANVSKGTKATYEGFIYLIRIRKFYNQNEAEEAPFSWGFACDWCNFTKPTIQKGLKWLLANGYLEKAKDAIKCGKREAALYKLKKEGCFLK